MKKIKINFGVIALLLGVTVAITGSAFKPVAQSEWGYDAATMQYYDVNNLPSGASYSCELSSEVCTAIYEGDPNVDGTLIRNEKEGGTFELIPQ